VDLELVSIEDEVAPALVVLDTDVDGSGALVSEVAAEFDVVNGELVVGGLRPI
jgi:hypothetical protein